MVFLYAPQSGAAEANRKTPIDCSSLLKISPVVAVFTDKVPITTVHIESGENIQKMVDDAHENFPGTQWKSKTIAEFDFKSAFGIAFDPVPGNQCFFIKTVEINFGIQKHDIYIPSEYAVGSCPYQALMDHEMMHVQANAQLVQDYASYIDIALRDWVKTLEPIVANSPEEASDMISEKVGKLVDPILDSFSKTQQFRAREINARMSYEKNQDRCRDW